MLGMMRRLTQNKFAGGILFGLVILSMAVWGPGLSDVFSGGFGTSIIQAGDRTASEQQINRKFENYLNNLRREQPGNAITRQQATEQGILDQIYNVERSRLTNLGFARSLGADASANALLEDVNTIEAFQDPLTNKFDTQYYRNALSRIDVTQREFESDTQDRLTLDYMREGVSAALVPPTDIARVQAIFDGEVRYISWFPIEKSAVPAPAEPTEEELKAFYETQSAIFEFPERRQISMLSLSSEDFIHQAEFTEEEVLTFYEATKFTRLEVDEERTFTEYRFPTEESAQAAFGIIAVGGDIPAQDGSTQIIKTLTSDQVAIEEFRTQLFSQGATPGAVAGPFAANGAWFVGRLIEIIPGTPKTLEETRDEIRAELAAEKAEIAYYGAINEIDELIDQGLNLAEIAESFGTPIISFAPVDQRGLTEDGAFLQAVTVSPEAFQQVFELPKGEFTDRFEGEASFVILAADRIIPKATPPFDENKERALAAYQITKENESLKAAADGAKAELDTGVSDMAEQAALYGSQVETPERGLRRTAFDRSLPQSVLRAAFTLEEDGISVVQGRAPNEMIVVKLDRIDRPKTSDLDVLAPISAPKIAEQLNQDILFAFGLEVQNAIEVKTNDAAFNAYKRRLLEDQ